MQKVFAVILAALTLTACSSNDDGSPSTEGGDLESQELPESDTQETFEPEPEPDSEPEFDESAEPESDDWQVLDLNGDAQGDCTQDDAECVADIVQLFYRVKSGTLEIKVEYANEFPVEEGSAEVFLVPPSKDLLGHSIAYGYKGAGFQFWSVDCSSAAKHAGCHWRISSIPDSLQAVWMNNVLWLSISLSDLGFDGLTEILCGTAAAPFHVEKTSEYTDRFPDDLRITPTDIQGLARLKLE